MALCRQIEWIKTIVNLLSSGTANGKWQQQIGLQRFQLVVLCYFAELGRPEGRDMHGDGDGDPMGQWWHDVNPISELVIESVWCICVTVQHQRHSTLTSNIHFVTWPWWSEWKVWKWNNQTYFFERKTK